MPNSRIYCLDLRIHNSARLIAEVNRIAKDNSLSLFSLGGLSPSEPPKPTPAQFARSSKPTNDTALPLHLEALVPSP